MDAANSKASKVCVVDGCEKPARGRMCRCHATRVERHGDPHFVIHQKDRNLPRGPASPKWAGDKVTYHGMHRRVKTRRGPASSHQCIDCGKPAQQWSYDRQDPNELQDPRGPYSTDIDRYVPRCIRCHKRHDLALLALIRPKVDPPIDLDVVRELRAQLWGVARIAKHLGVSRRRVERALAELGLPRLKPGSPHAATALVGFRKDPAPDAEGVAR